MAFSGVKFGQLVREKRGIEQLSQDDLAAKTHLTKARISELETGKIRSPQAKTVDALCVALDISPRERAGCHVPSVDNLPSRLLEKLARHFGSNMPDATEEELGAFLMAKAEEFEEMRQRLMTLAASEGRISELINAANAALAEGDIATADDLLKKAEAVQLQTTTIIALNKQAQLRIERGKAALVMGDIEAAARHFERSSRYFSGIDAELEADNRHECASLLRYYGYRYESCDALRAARSALELNLLTRKKDGQLEKWCQTKSALGGVALRMAEFDIAENTVSHLTEAKLQYEDVLAVCSEEVLPKSFAVASTDLANVVSKRCLADSVEGYESNLRRALSLQLSALRFFSESDDPRSWGILQHNLGCSYISLSNVRNDEAKSAADIEKAIYHLEMSFNVRNQEESLQFWIASCRSLAQALLNMSTYSITKDADDYVRRASGVLNRAAARISPDEHPHQWAELQTQLSRCAERKPT